MKKSYLLIVFISLISCEAVRSQVDSSLTMSDEEYEVINDLYGGNEADVFVYFETDFSKTWSYLMHPRYLDELYGPPCNNGKEILEWEDIFSIEDFSKISSIIRKSYPYKLDKSRLSKHIILSDNYRQRNEYSSSVRIITRPIILKNLAIIKQSDFLNELIIIASKSSGKWKPICTKWVVLTNED